MIVLGRVIAPYGTKGWLNIQPFGDDPLSWGKMPHWWLASNAETPDDLWMRYALHGCHTHGKGLVACFEGITDRTAAESLSGRYVAAPRESLPPPEENEYYWSDLIGMSVRSEAGEPLGEVTKLLSTGAHDVLQVQDGDTERLIPFVSAYVLDVDLVARSIRTAWQKDW
ncbi:MAG: ribosome maturation factor RimM [Azoarcus sp.]|jgi:16S rRNA processing protein RimM|nr:ribosome maturation factor RimM [Azoarcus sp.]